MKKLTLDFYGEKISIPFPQDFASLSKEIDQNFQINLSEVFSLDISYTKNKVKKSIKSENDYKLFINSKATLINIELVESNELFQNNSLNFKKNSKEDKDKLEALKKKKAALKTKIEQKEKETQIKKEEYQLQVDSLNNQKTQYLNKLQKDMKDQSKKEKDFVTKITQLSKELNVPLTFKVPEKGPKEYLELIKKYNECLKMGEKLFSGPRKNINDLDNQIKKIYKKYYGNNKSSQEEVFELKKEENSISEEIEKIEIKFGLIKKEPKNKTIDDSVNNFGKKMKDLTKKQLIKVKEEMKKLKEKMKKEEYEVKEEEKEFLQKIEKENKQSLREVEKWIEFISIKSQDLIESLEKKNVTQMKQLEDFNKRIDLSKSLDELTVGPGVEKIGATMPYTRYDSDEASLGGGASIVTSPNHLQDNIASQASKQCYVTLPNSGAYAEWTMKSTGRGVTMRFTLPDTSDGMGQNGSLDVYVNNNKVKTVNLTSYYM